jgi:hypothetical protein
MVQYSSIASAFDRWVMLEEMKADKGQFDEVLRRMLKEPPKKTAEIKADKKKPKPSQK